MVWVADCPLQPHACRAIRLSSRLCALHVALFRISAPAQMACRHEGLASAKV